MTVPRILVAGIGNIFLGDDAFGVEVVRRLAQREPHAAVRVVDFGIRSFDLAYALLDGYDFTILVDAVPGGGSPGTLYVIEPDLRGLEEQAPEGTPVEAHAMNPLEVLRLVKSMGGEFHRMLLIGCEPEPLDEAEDGRMGLSAPVSASVNEAVSMIEEILKATLESSEGSENANRKEGGT